MATITLDTATARKARGAFFTPHEITRHLADWALEHAHDSVLEPSAGEAAFLVAAVRRLKELGSAQPLVHGVELHAESARIAAESVASAGGIAKIEVRDFFSSEPRGTFAAVIGNPPFIRYQDFAGDARERARSAARSQSVILSGLASSWAAFVVHSAAHLRPGGRLGMVLPAELMTTNYAAPVRQFLLERFESIELVTFESQIFPDAEADTVLVKAAGWLNRPLGFATLRQTRDATTLRSLSAGQVWNIEDPAARWAPLHLSADTAESIAKLTNSGDFSPLGDLGSITLGMVTGKNAFFALTPARARELGIPRRDLLPLSPPGSSHLRGLSLTDGMMARLGDDGRATWLLYPSEDPAPETLAYIQSGHAAGIDMAYKCRVRSPWWRVPLLRPADLLLTYMNADTPRLSTNLANAHHLNSVHGVYLSTPIRSIGRELLPLASLNTMTLLSAEMRGRSYGGGILKIEPREADLWWMPSPAMLRRYRSDLMEARARVEELLAIKDLLGAAAVVDAILLRKLTARQLDALRADHAAFMLRRMNRGKNG